jgi:hypothetical protein
MTREDRATHRKWTCAWFIAYSVLLGAMGIVSLATRPEPRTKEASQAVSTETIVNFTASTPASARKNREK